MKLSLAFKAMAATAALVVGTAASAASVYCPGSTTGVSPSTSSVAPPTSGRYVFVTGAEAGGLCAYNNENLDGNNNLYTQLGLTLLDKSGDPGTFLISGDPGSVTNGTWTLTSNIWSTYEDLYLGFHFGQGGGNPDSFIVELARDTTSGTWSFNAVLPATINGLSDIYLFRGDLCVNGNCEGPTVKVPEPGSLALFGLGLAGLALIRRRRPE